MHTASDTFLRLLNLAFEQTPKILGFVAFGIDELVFLERLNVKIVNNQALLVTIENGLYFGHILIDYLFDGCFNH